MDSPIIATKEALRMFKRRFRAKHKQYPGTAEEICEAIIKDAWEPIHRYFRVSSGHFCEFYCRDFGWVCSSLLALGHRDRVISTLEYALSTFQKYDRITVAITPNQIPFDFPSLSPDSIAYITYCLSLVNDISLTERYRSFLEKEISRYVDLTVDKNGLIRKDRHFSSMKDHSLRASSCYDNCMLYLLQSSAQALNLHNPLKAYNYPELLKKHFWTGTHFRDDLSGSNYIAGDANVFPFWTGAIQDPKLLSKAIQAIRSESLDLPMPLRYTSNSNTEVKFRWFTGLVSDYERHVVWTHMGPLYIEITGLHDPSLQRQYIAQYTQKIEEYHNFLETYTPEGIPFKNLVYYTDESMIWCANYLCLKRNSNKTQGYQDQHKDSDKNKLQ